MKDENMEIDDDIVRAKVPEYIKDTLNLFHKELQQGETDYFGMLTRLAVIIDTKARADTAKQIFKELEDNVIHIRGNNEDIRISWSSAKKYFTLKKKYNIEE